MVPKRKNISLNQKLEVILDIENGKKQSQFAEEKGILPCTISRIWNKREEIKKHHENFNPGMKKVRKCAHPEIDSALIKWLDSMRAQNIPISGPLLQEPGKVFAERFGVQSFHASSGWLEKWKKRHNVSFQMVCGEAGAVDINTVDNWLETIWPKLKQGYQPEDIFNCDETGLFYKCLPNKTMNRKGMTCTGGKLSKERVSVLLCTNSTGSEKLKPLVIGKFENPRCFKHIKKKNLPVDYYFNKISWMTQVIFGDWLRKLDLRMRFRRRHILLLMDNCGPHKVSIKTPNIKIVFLPPNVTSKLQPLDLGIINSTKHHYKSRVVRKIISLIEERKEPGINLLDAIMLLHSAWKDVTGSTIKNCYQKSKLLEVSADENAVEVIPDAINENELNALRIPAELLEDFYHVDDNVLPFEVPTDTDIAEELLRSEEESLVQDEGEDDPIIERPVISNSAAAECIDKLRWWFFCQDAESPDILPSLEVLEDIVGQQKILAMKQTVLTDFFTPPTSD